MTTFFLIRLRYASGFLVMDHAPFICFALSAILIASLWGWRAFRFYSTTPTHVSQEQPTSNGLPCSLAQRLSLIPHPSSSWLRFFLTLSLWRYIWSPSFHLMWWCDCQMFAVLQNIYWILSCNCAIKEILIIFCEDAGTSISICSEKWRD